MPTNNNQIENSVYKTDDSLYNKEIKSVPKPSASIGIDVEDKFYDNIIGAGLAGQLDISALDAFSQVTQRRDQIYQLIDMMCQDATIAAILETYAEDSTETNDDKQIVWVESDDGNIGKMVTYFLDAMCVDKNIYKWVYSLCKYGDLYLRLYRESDYAADGLFDKEEVKKELNGGNNQLNEDVKIKAYSKTDHYVHYLEMVPNPAEMFELTKFGKTYAYIKANSKISNNNVNQLQNSYLQYKFKKSDVEVHSATDYVHASLEDNSSRTPEEVQIFLDNNDTESGDDSALTYTVKRGQSLLYNVFKIWRELALLENSILLNRVTKSSIVRMISVEVGDMPKEMVQPHLQGIKSLIEQKAALDEGNSLNEYTNPGPIENNVYIPTRNGKGSIAVSQVGGDVNVGQLTDLDYFKNKFYGAMRVPKQYFGETDDGAGFNGGQSLSIISSRYAKMIKRIQNTIIQALTDAINLLLIDKGLQSYINKFTIHMLPPTTQEEIDRRDNLSSKVQITSDIMNIVTDIGDPVIKLKILKSLLSSVITDTDVIALIEEEIERLEEEAMNSTEIDSAIADESLDSLDSAGGDLGDLENLSDLEDTESESELMDMDLDSLDSEDSGEDSRETILPSPYELGQDFTDSENF